MEQAAADFTVIDQGEQGLVLHLTGAMDIETLGDVPDRLDDLPNIYGDRITTIDMQQVEHLDTVGAWVVYRVSRDNNAEIINMGEANCRLVEAIGSADEPGELVPEAPAPFNRILGQMGAAVIHALNNMMGTLGFFGAMVIVSGRLLRHPGRIRMRALIRQMEQVGVSALAIVGLMSFLIGVVIAQQGAVQLRQFGAEVFTVNLVGRITLRELGVLMTAIMVAGRSGSAFAAQIGTMQLTEEVDAMRTIGVSPMEALIMPRVAASVVMMPLLGFYASMLALIGGGLLCWVYLDIPPATFVSRIREVVPMHDVWIGLIKAPVFGMIIGIAGCYQGMQVRGNAEEVGIRTTAAVVQAIFVVIVLDAFFAIFFTAIGWG